MFVEPISDFVVLILYHYGGTHLEKLLGTGGFCGQIIPLIMKIELNFCSDDVGAW